MQPGAAGTPGRLAAGWRICGNNLETGEFGWNYLTPPRSPHKAISAKGVQCGTIRKL